jgi:hypothetical protein
MRIGVIYRITIALLEPHLAEGEGGGCGYEGHYEGNHRDGD